MANMKIQCPYCGHGFYFGSAEKHRQKAHPEIEFAKFLVDIERAKRQGKLKFKRQKQPKSKGKKPAMRTSTTVLQDERKTNKGIRSVVSAGAFGMGKKR